MRCHSNNFNEKANGKLGTIKIDADEVNLSPGLMKEGGK